VLFERLALLRQRLGLAGVVLLPQIAFGDFLEGYPFRLAVFRDGDVLGFLLVVRLFAVFRFRGFGLGFRGLFRRLLRFGVSGNALVSFGGASSAGESGVSVSAGGSRNPSILAAASSRLGPWGGVSGLVGMVSVLLR